MSYKAAAKLTIIGQCQKIKLSDEDENFNDLHKFMEQTESELEFTDKELNEE